MFRFHQTILRSKFIMLDLQSIPLHTERTHAHQTLCCHITTLTFYIL